jgi:hypothetical protein
MLQLFMHSMQAQMNWLLTEAFWCPHSLAEAHSNGHHKRHSHCRAAHEAATAKVYCFSEQLA